MPALRSLSRGGLFLLTTAIALIAACTADDELDQDPTAADPSATVAPVTDIDFVSSDAPRRAASPAAAASVGAATNAFAADLYALLAATNGDDNVVFSPYSAAVALAMTSEGARGQTASEIDAILHTDLAGGDLAAGFNGLDQALAAIPGEYPFGDVMVDLDLSTANQLFGQVGFGFEPEFLDTLAADYGAGMRLVDYLAATEDARQQINGWVGDQTRDRIPELIPKGVLNEDTRLVLTNAVYLNAPWQHRFAAAGTADAPFTRLDGTQVNVPLMHLNSPRGTYGDGPGYQAVELPYVGGQLSMLVVVPDAGEFESIEASLDANQIAGFRSSLRGVGLDLSFPKFEFRTQSPLKDALTQLGMPTAFTDAADFSGITSDAPLAIAEVLHEAFIAVDEEGTEAAAATAVIAFATSAPAEFVELTVDRPFLFFIQERETGATLFMGRVTDPTAE